MSSKSIYKIVHQYSKEFIPEEDMQKLQEIAEDYKKVKNYVYTRFGGIASLSKLYPGYTVQNEMAESGLRETWGVPSVYFYLAVFDALGDIKAQWTRTKSQILKQVGQNEGFTEDEKHYLRFLLKVNNAFEQILNGRPVELVKEVQAQYDLLAEKVNVDKLHRYLCRHVRKYQVKLHTETASGFSITERAYRYGEQGIYISTKEKRKRLFVPLTDHNQYRSQLYIKLYSEEGRIEIQAPVQVSARKYAEYTNKVGVAYGMHTMLTTDEGHCYGEAFGEYQIAYADWLRMQARSYYKNKSSNPGRKKYNAKKRCLEEQLHSYMNQELNRFLKTEKPKTIYLVKLPETSKKSGNKRINYLVNLWQRGYIRKRLTQKCEEQSIEIIEVFGKDISNECSCCGRVGKKADGEFFCPLCGYCEEEKRNTARNIKKRGQGEGFYKDHKSGLLDESRR